MKLQHNDFNSWQRKETHTCRTLMENGGEKNNGLEASENVSASENL